MTEHRRETDDTVPIAPVLPFPRELWEESGLEPRDEGLRPLWRLLTLWVCLTSLVALAALLTN